MLSTRLPAIGKRYLGDSPQSKIRLSMRISVPTFHLSRGYCQDYEQILSNEMCYSVLGSWEYYIGTSCEIENSRTWVGRSPNADAECPLTLPTEKEKNVTNANI